MKKRGFTVYELVIVMAIMTIILGSILSIIISLNRTIMVKQQFDSYISEIRTVKTFTENWFYNYDTTSFEIYETTESVVGNTTTKALKVKNTTTEAIKTLTYTTTEETKTLAYSESINDTQEITLKNIDDLSFVFDSSGTEIVKCVITYNQNNKFEFLLNKRAI